MFFTLLFFFNIVDNKGDCNRVGCMSPQSWFHTFVISVGSQMLLQEFIGQYACFRVAPNGSSDLQKYEAVPCMLSQVVLLLYPFREKGQGYFHILVIIQGRGEWIASLIINAPSACWLTNHALALIPPGTGEGGRIINGDVVVRIHCEHHFSVIRPASGGINLDAACWITGTAPGALFCVCLWWVCVVLVKFCLAIGSRICIISGASEIRVIGRGSTCSIAGATLLFALFALCSTPACGVRMSLRAFCKHLMS